MANSVKKTSDPKKKPTRKENFLNPSEMMKSPKSMFSNVFFYIFVFITLYLIFSTFAGSQPQGEEVAIGDILKHIKDERVQNITVYGDDVGVSLRDGTLLRAKKETQISFDQILTNNNIDREKIAGELRVEQRMSFEQIIMTVGLYGIPILILFFIFRQMRSAGGDLFSFGKSRARMFVKESSDVTFKDVAGVDEAKREMMEIVDFLKNPKKYQDVGARVPKGVLLVGPAGVGKTLLAKAIAGEAGVPFFSVAGSEFMEALVGIGSARTRDLFSMAKAAQPSLIFIDEIDAIGRQRGMGIGGGHDEREQTLNQILIEMDGFDTRTNVIVLASTNRPDMLDPALVRAGRFDRKISVQMPDLEDRKQILQIHMRGKPFAEDFNLEQVAKKTVGFSGADLENMLNEAAIMAAREERKFISMPDIDEALLKVTLGPERRKLQNEYDRKVTAYHEAGHAIVGAYVPDLDPIGRVTIVPRGGSLGHTSLPPERDRYNETKTRLNSMLAMMMGGRAAEDLVFNEMTTGASSDIDKATQVARKMVTEFGMSALGPIAYHSEQSGWVAKQMGEGQPYSQQMAAKIDDEVKKIIDAAYAKATELLVKHKLTLDKVSAELIERETIDGDEFKKLLEVDVLEIDGSNEKDITN